MKKKLVFLIRNWEDILAAIFLSVMVLTAIFNVFTRYILNYPFTWAEELECICLVWATFTSAAAAYKKNMHYGMDFLVDRLPMKSKILLRRIIVFISIFFFAFLLYLSILFIGQVTKTTIFFRLSYKYIDLAAIVGFLSMEIYSILYFIESFTHPERFAARYIAAYEEDHMESINGGNS